MPCSQQRQHSYRDLPKRWAELGTVYRYERSGTMHGLFRVRGFTQVLALCIWNPTSFPRCWSQDTPPLDTGSILKRVLAALAALQLIYSMHLSWPRPKPSDVSWLLHVWVLRAGRRTHPLPAEPNCADWPGAKKEKDFFGMNVRLRLSFHTSFASVQDDAHIFCLPGQIAAEIGRVLDLTEDIMTAFGFQTEGFEVQHRSKLLSQLLPHFRTPRTCPKSDR